ncbi:flagellar hook-associated protein FlgK [Bacillus thermotolerans]|uniref:flagellar hook-associated protein FlgK n=1 Tax=Bacillus thermotolerans TaxID=1221996 RepID=UPI0005893797|nr:flagellar hook-associated protein FlgK [Bacillus thermotolerans]KKB42995.1 Flagellar hook-associated protein FlgK [Bacillus thermotolerans]
MRSTFHGLETAKRAMFAQQSAISTTGHNIANANTPGYTRQRVNLQQTEAYPAPSMNRPQIPGQLGTGVEAGSIQRVREEFLDTQYRGENNKLGYWQARTDALSKMEDIMNEPSDSGLSAVMGQFWQSLQDLSVNPENEGARSVVLQRGEAVVDTFHYLHDSLSSIQKDFGNQVDVTLKEVNSILEQISGLNQQISEIEPNGYLPNDLYDERDRLVDQLSEHINVKVEKIPPGGNALAIAEGAYKISLMTDGGSVELVNGKEFNKIGVTNGTDIDGDGLGDQVDGPVSSFTVNGKTIAVENFSQGNLKGLAEAYGYSKGGETEGIYAGMLNDLDKLAYTFGKLFNDVHSRGYDLEGETGTDFFDGLGQVEGAAASIQMGSLSVKDIAASTEQANGGDGTHAGNLANVPSMLLNQPHKLAGSFNPEVSIDPQSVSSEIKTGTINSFYEGIIGGLGVDAQQALRMAKNSEVLTQSVDTNRQSISSVSLDEEFTNLIKYQHAYNAAARNITVVDEMLDKIINGMGVVGR